jgi:hypothetical protein
MQMHKCAATAVFIVFLAVGAFRPVADARREVEAWRTDMAAFVKEVLDVAKGGTIPREEPWTVGGINGMKRSGTLLYGPKPDEVCLGVLPHAAGGGPGELSTELFRRFPSVTVSWQGTVESAKVDDDKKRHIITISFPPHSGPVKISLLPLRIPFEKLARDRLPVKGEAFAFSGSLRVDNDSILKDPVEVLYFFSRSDHPGEQWVLVSLEDVVPLSANTAKPGTATMFPGFPPPAKLN